MIRMTRTNRPDALKVKLQEKIAELPVIDAHEHLWSEAERLEIEADVFSLLTPFVPDALVCAGASPKLKRLWAVDPATGLPKRPGLTPNETWRLIAPFWPLVRQTSQVQAFMGTLREWFGVDDLTAENWLDLSVRIAKETQPGLYNRVLAEKCGIRRYIAVKAFNWHGVCPPEGIGRWVLHMWPFARWQSLAEVTLMEKATGASIRSLQDVAAVIAGTVETAKQAGYVGIKVARGSTVPMGQVDADTAAALFEKVLRSSPAKALPAEQLQPLWDYCLYLLFAAAGENKLTVAVHTSGFPDRNSCTALVDAVRRFPEVRFDLYHGSIPETREIAFLAKSCPNVYLNMCWMPAVSQTMAANALEEWLDLVPLNKIVGFGGDCFYVENVVGTLAAARDVLAEALGRRVRAGRMVEKEAVDAARRLLHDNAAALYRLDV